MLMLMLMLMLALRDVMPSIVEQRTSVCILGTRTSQYLKGCLFNKFKTLRENRTFSILILRIRRAYFRIARDWRPEQHCARGRKPKMINQVGPGIAVKPRLVALLLSPLDLMSQ